jgi:hypothetical protein
MQNNNDFEALVEAMRVLLNHHSYDSIEQALLLATGERGGNVPLTEDLAENQAVDGFPVWEIE